jgi:hypothetical protein
MHCSNCGSYLAPGVRFCSGCGSASPDPEVTRIARTQGGVPAADYISGGDRDNDLEQVVFTVRPTMIFIKLGYALAVLGAIGIVILLALIPIPVYISIALALTLLLIPAYYHLRRNMVRYTLTDSKIEIDTGLIARTTRNIPLSKIQDVTVCSVTLASLVTTPTCFCANYDAGTKLLFSRTRANCHKRRNIQRTWGSKADT